MTTAAVFRPNNGTWFIKGPGNLDWNKTTQGNLKMQCGSNGDIPLLGNIDGTLRNRLIVFRPSNGMWYIKGHGKGDWNNSKDNLKIQCGQNNDIPLVADCLNEGRNRLIVFRPSNGTWYIKGLGNEDWSKSKDNVKIQCGQEGDIPLVADFLNEGKNRLGVFRPSNGTWYIKGLGNEDWNNSKDNVKIQCGQNLDIPLVRNFFGDGNRLCVFRPNDGTWYIKGLGNEDWSKSKDNVKIQCGQKEDIPVAGSFFGNGVRICVFRPNNGTWFIKGVGRSDWNNSKNNLKIQFGAKNDIPVLGHSQGTTFNLSSLLFA